MRSNLMTRWLSAVALLAVATAACGGPGSYSRSYGGRSDSGQHPAHQPGAPASEFSSCLWVTRYEFASARDIEQLVADAARAGVTALFFQVRGNGTVLYASNHELWSEQFGFESPGYDPLATVLKAARAHNIAVHAWLNLVPGWRGDISKADSRQLIKSRPRWFLADADGRPAKLENNYYWLDPENPSVRAYLSELCRELVQNYTVDGVHLDHIRYPTGFGGPAPVTALVEQLAATIRETRASTKVTAAVFAEPAIALSKVGQDWPAWCRAGLLDACVPMNYSADDLEFSGRMRRGFAAAADTPVVVGIGVYKHDSPQQTRRQIAVVRRAGAAGVALFSASALFAPDKVAYRDAAFRPYGQ